MDETLESLIADVVSLGGAACLQLATRLREFIKEKQARIHVLEEEVRKKDALLRLKGHEIAHHKRTIDKLQKMQFGPNSDRNPTKKERKANGEADTNRDAHSSVIEEDSASGIQIGQGSTRADNGGKHTSNGRGKQLFPEHLERKVRFMGQPDQKCPCGCGGAAIGYDTVETLQVIPAKFFVEVQKYPKCRCLISGKIKGTPFAQRLFPHTGATNALLAHTINMRFGWQIPLYRQEAMLRSQGVVLHRSTVMRWQDRVASEALKALFDLMEAELKKTGARLFMDETTLPQLQPGKGKTRTTYLYALLRDDRSFGGKDPPIVLYYHRPSRAMKEIDDILRGVKAIVQTDAYAGYGRVGDLGTSSEGSVRTKCWAHTRRNMTDEYEFNETTDAAKVVRLIDELYRVERSVRGSSPAVRKAQRLKYSVQILQRMKAFLSECSYRHLRRSGMGKAIRYSQKHWEELVQFIDDGRIDLDTNAVERMFKPIIMLRKAALFVGSEIGGQTWAILASIIETCKLNKVNVEQYLTWVLDQITAKLPRSRYGELLPWNAPEKFLVGR